MLKFSISKLQFSKT